MDLPRSVGPLRLERAIAIAQKHADLPVSLENRLSEIRIAVALKSPITTDRGIPPTRWGMQLEG